LIKSIKIYVKYLSLIVGEGWERGKEVGSVRGEYREGEGKGSGITFLDR